jgi:CRISPR/Cas system-associated exonuclease Cas4 (RecB family)
MRNNPKISLSRSKIEEFIICPRCFYFSEKHKIKKPSLPPLTLNNAVDTLLKKEFDLYRSSNNRENHYILNLIKENFNLDLKPYESIDLIKKWRNSGIKFFYQELGLEVSGKIDDVLINDENKLFVIDFKSTSTNQEINLDTGGYKDSYKREVEIYQWLLTKNGFDISNISIFVFANAIKNSLLFNNRLDFEIKPIIYEGNFNWVEDVLKKIKDVLESNEPPMPGENCEHCQYYYSRSEKEINLLQ